MATVTKHEAPPTPPPTYTIELNEDEATELKALLGQCAPSPGGGLFKRLGEVGVGRIADFPRLRPVAPPNRPLNLKYL